MRNSSHMSIHNFNSSLNGGLAILFCIISWLGSTRRMWRPAKGLPVLPPHWTWTAHGSATTCYPNRARGVCWASFVRIQQQKLLFLSEKGRRTQVLSFDREGCLIPCLSKLNIGYIEPSVLSWTWWKSHQNARAEQGETWWRVQNDAYIIVSCGVCWLEQWRWNILK